MENSLIQWTDHTFNPWEGCTKVSPGCFHCYAETRNARFGGGTAPNWGKGAPRRRTSESNWNKPKKWNADFWPKNPARQRVFCASLADWLDDEVPIKWLADLLKLIHDTPNLDWLLLTKRPENWEKRVRLAQAHHFDFGDRNVCGWLWDWVEHQLPPANIWLGTTVEDQPRAIERIPRIQSIPARVRFLSCEPLLGPLDLKFMTMSWVICGGESGPGARPMDIAWARQLHRQCSDLGIPFFMKQLGGVSDHRGELDNFPEDLRVRQFPNQPR